MTDGRVEAMHHLGGRDLETFEENLDSAKGRSWGMTEQDRLTGAARSDNVPRKERLSDQVVLAVS